MPETTPSDVAQLTDELRDIKYALLVTNAGGTELIERTAVALSTRANEVENLHLINELLHAADIVDVTDTQSAATLRKCAAALH